jgi:hypothetical protein
MNSITAMGTFTRKVRIPKLTQGRARDIMGRNMFGVEEASKHFGVNPSTQELAYLAAIPFSEDTLTACRYSHILIAVFPLSILDIRSRVDRSLFSSTDFDIIKSRDLYREDILLNEQKFAKDHGTNGWYLVRKDSVPDSVGLSWSSQRRCLGINNKVPSARVLIYTIVGYYLSTGVRLFTALPHVRCSDRLSFGHGVVVSNWMEGDLIGVASGIGCSNYSRVFSDERLGVASERKR